MGVTVGERTPVGCKLPPTPPVSECNRFSRSPSPSSCSTDSENALPLPPPRPQVNVLDVDKNTPDRHVPRDPRLIRLTGTHPFNVEAPLSDLFNEGFLTSQELFYVRNHGAVPQVDDGNIPDWEFSVEGEFLSEFEQVTYPATLVCAGNRRKEQNVVRKTKGFSWGAAGVSTALWTGVPMSALIRRASPRRKARYVCMEGADNLGNYGTSVKLSWVLDPNRGIMLAHKMNGETLSPDHGKPLRVIIPGQIGGRSVKWLKRLIVTEKPSDNWYHIYDNRVLPTTVSPEESANDPRWWQDERYAIYDLNCNSAIAYPANDERLCLKGAPSAYRVKGYAYSGGGRRITRVEVSTDRGKTWRLANIDYPEDRYREVMDGTHLYGGRLDLDWRDTTFCWCFWNIDVSVDELKEASDLVVRSMDESMQVQPRDMYWSVLGMMNNPWFRISIAHEGDYLRFEHPTLPALMSGGWMERVKKAGGNLTNGMWGEGLDNGKHHSADSEARPEDIKLTKDGVDRVITIDELSKHDNAEGPWFVLNGQVYDGRPFMQEHPGGAQSIISAAGMDTSDEFMAIHSETAKAMMPSYHIGQLDEASRKALAEGEVQESASAEPREYFLNDRSWNKALLHSKTTVSWDTRTFRFQLQHEEQNLGLPTGKHIMLRLRDPATRETIIRAYTPISEEKQKGYVDVLVKVYFNTDDRKGGKMSQAMDSLPMGHFVDFKGPIGKFQYLGRGRCTVNSRERIIRNFFMICGGSGITPIFQVFRAIMQDKHETTHCTILDGNRLVDDILCRKELDEYALGNGHKCKVLHTLTQAPEDWKGLRGRIAEPLLKEHCKREHAQSMVLICGPEALEKSVHRALREQGWPDEDLLFF
ncbi:MAG: hypothetical protein Q9162_002539 [Coniocarpon cinnabarinum]